MALLDIFKKKSAKGGSPPKADAPLEHASGGKPTKVHEAKPSAVPSKPKKISGLAYKILKKPRVTEKAADLTAKNQYIFEVFSESNKNQIKRAVEDVYGVDVVKVNIINTHPKRRRLGRIEGWSSGYKKAIVKIKKGQKIEVLPR